MKKVVVRVSDELMTLIENPKAINMNMHCICLWCGMIKAFRNRVCELCGNWGNSSKPVTLGSGITITYTHDNAPATARGVTVKPGRRVKPKTTARSASDRTQRRSSSR